MEAYDLLKEIRSGARDAFFLDLYSDCDAVLQQRERYMEAIGKFVDLYGTGEVFVFSAPGRSEIGGNHTDHQRGCVLAAAINRDIIAVVRKTQERCIRIVSDSEPEYVIDVQATEVNKEFYGTTEALIRGVIAGFEARGYIIGGFQAYATSEVPIGSGMSSSAAFETLLGVILSELYNESKVSPVEIAQISQYAENVYFGKPCGLMDQMACSLGNMVFIDFNNPKEPEIEQIEPKLADNGYCMCITDTKGSHADLTADYAAIPHEMRQVAAYFGHEVLREVNMEEILSEITSLRDKFGDRCVLRALHFMTENERVQEQVKALKGENFRAFLDLVKASGDSSYKYLQNVYTVCDIEHQNISLALQLSDMFPGTISRVHGGGFAGTIQTFVPQEEAQRYCEQMNRFFGPGACNVLQIRKVGGARVM